MAITRPTNLVRPFAESAGAGFKRSIPDASQISITPGAASLVDGFPPLNFLDPTAGGVPPSGQDFNGILNILSQHTAFQGSGGEYRFDATLSTALGGYPVGTVLQNNAGTQSYVNALAGNTTDFNTTPASIGVSWFPYAGPDAITQPLFDNTTKIATTEYAMRMGLHAASSIVVITTNTTLAPSTSGAYVVSNLGTGNVICTLPLLADVPVGTMYIFDHQSAAMTSFSVASQGSDLLTYTGSSPTSISPLAMTNGDGLFIISRGSSWRVIASNSAGFLNNGNGFTSVLANPGSQKLPSGLRFKFGSATASATPGNPVAVSFVTAFPTACLGVVATGLTTNTANAAVWYDTPTTTGFNLRAALGSQSAFYVAVGY